MHREEGVPIHTVTYRNRSLPGQRAPLTAIVSANPTQSETEQTPALEAQNECSSSAKTGQIIRSDLVVATSAIPPRLSFRASAFGRSSGARRQDLSTRSGQLRRQVWA
jgi:hypothetical protein